MLVLHSMKTLQKSYSKLTLECLKRIISPYNSLFIFIRKIEIFIGVIMRIKIVGINFTEHTAVENEVISFVHEADNVHDPNAIAVINSDGHRFGYVATSRTLTNGNRKNGCIDNVEFLQVLNSSTKGVVDKIFDSFGYANIQ